MSTPDVVLLGRVATLGGERGYAWADGVAIRGGRVSAVGRRDEIEHLAGRSTRRIELAPGEAALPGLTDSHLHLVEAALGARRVDLSDAATLDEGLRRIAAAHATLPADAWLEGHGWDPDRWGTWPTASALERTAPGRRVALWAHDHHALWSSEAGLAAAGVDADTPDPPGGVVRRDADGEPTGVLHETATLLVTQHVPLADVEHTARAVAAFEPQLIRLGVVAVHDPGGLSLDPSLDRGVEPYRRLADRGELQIRVHACIRPEQLDSAIEAGFRSGAPVSAGGEDAVVRAGWLKLFADGTLGSRTAALLEPAQRLAGEMPPPNDGLGLWMTEPDELRRLAERAAENGVTTTIHAIGDAAVRVGLDVLAPTVGRTALVPRLEHVQLLADEDLPRFSQAGIAASIQPIHVRSDAAKARRVWGEHRESRSYPYGPLAASGALIPFGTDAPVEPIDPWPGIACAVTRAAPSWPESVPPFGPASALSLERALRAQCIDPALSAGERDRGRLVPGQRADVVVVPSAALEEPVEVGGALWHARPRLVLIGGRVAWEA